MERKHWREAWRRSVSKRKVEDAEREPLNLRTDPHTPTRWTRIMAVSAIVLGFTALVARGGRLGPSLAPGGVVWLAAGAAALCTVAWMLLYRRAKARKLNDPSP